MDGKRLALVPVLAVAVALSAPLLIWGSPFTDSEWYNYLWTRQFAEGYARGDFYPRWFFGSFEGLGSPTFYFYPPLAFWISGAIDAFGASTDAAVIATTVLFMAASGLSMYAWLRFRGTRPILGACLYMAAPYHLLDVYQRGALAEFAGFVWLPLIALGIEALPRRWAAPLLAVSTGGLLITHLPLSILAAVFLIAPAALWAVKRDRSVVAPGLAAGVVGVALAVFYLLPALTLQDHISESRLWGAHFQPSKWFIWNGRIPIYLAFLPVLAFVVALCGLAARSFWSAVAVVAGAASVGLVPFIWDVPLMAKVQFPWRVLAVGEFAAITVLASAPRMRFVAGGAIMLATAAIIAPIFWAPRFAIEMEEAKLEAFRFDAPEYLAKGFDPPGLKLSEREVDLKAYRSLPRGPVIDVTQAGAVTARRAAFPIWRVVRDGQVVPSRGPLITFDASPGRYRIERVVLWQEWLGGLVSLAGLAGLVAMWARLQKAP